MLGVNVMQQRRRALTALHLQLELAAAWTRFLRPAISVSAAHALRDDMMGVVDVRCMNVMLSRVQLLGAICNTGRNENCIEVVQLQ